MSRRWKTVRSVRLTALQFAGSDGDGSPPSGARAVVLELGECSFDVVTGEMPAVSRAIARELTHHFISERNVVLVGDALVVGVIEEERTGELRRAAATISPFEARGTVVHQRETRTVVSRSFPGRFSTIACPLCRYPT